MTMKNTRLNPGSWLLLCWAITPSALAQTTANVAPAASVSLLKTLLGLAVVLGVVMLVAWLAKRYMPGMGTQTSAVRIVGGVNVGTRERVVVLEIAGRWIVVGVGAGQVNNIANLDPGTPINTTSPTMPETQVPAGFDKAIPSFAHWLKQSMTNRSEK